MGFRSTFTTLDNDFVWPDWFITKYRERIHFPVENVGAIHSKYEAKTYMTWAELHDDIQRALREQDEVQQRLVLVYLHECGGITRCQIERDRILWSEPERDGWRKVDGVTHHYCYGCSDAPE